VHKGNYLDPICSKLARSSERSAGSTTQNAKHERSKRVVSTFRFRGGGTRHIIDLRKFKDTLPTPLVFALLCVICEGKKRIVFANPLETKYTSLITAPKPDESDVVIFAKTKSPFSLRKSAELALMALMDEGGGHAISVLDRNLIVIAPTEKNSSLWIASKRIRGGAPCRPRHFDQGLLRLLCSLADQRVIVDAKRHGAWRESNLAHKGRCTLVVTTTAAHVHAWKEFFGTGGAD
jgi:hypothetical protein